MRLALSTAGGGLGARVRKATAVVVAFSLAVFGIVPFGQPALALADPANAVLGQAIEELGTVIAVGSSIEELAEALPLTGLAPAASDGLDLLNSLNTELNALNAEVSAIEDAPSSDAVKEAIERESTVGGVTITIADVEIADDAGVIDYTIPLEVTRTVQVPVAFESSVFDMAGSTISINLEVATTLHLRFDTNGTIDPTTAIWLASAPVLSLTADIDPAVDVSASTRIGVAEATAAIDGLDLQVAFTVPLVDPDGTGGITRDEWLNTTVDDLVGEVTRSGNVAGMLSFDTTLIPGTPDTPQISIADPDGLANGYNFTLPALGNLADFGLITPAAIIAGIGQAAAGLGGAQTVGDVDLPFITGSVRKIAQASRPILDVVDALGVVCGTEGGETGVPAGSIEDLADNTLVYCRAIVTTGVAAGSITWNSPSADETDNHTGADADGTVGITQTKNAVFTKDGDGDFVVSVEYDAVLDDGDPDTTDVIETRTSTQAPMSVQALASAFTALGPFTAPAESLFQYNSTTHALTADLSMTFDPTEITLPINVGSQLESATGVAGLQTTAGNVEIDAGPISLKLKAGVFLLPEEDWDEVKLAGGCPDPSITDPALCNDALNLFFVEVDPAAGEFSLADATFGLSDTPEPSLSGQLGYLEVTAAVPTFQVTRADPALPVIRVDLTPSATMTVGAANVPVPNAIPLRKLLFDILGRTTVSPLNLKFNGNFEVSAALNGSEIASAGVGVTWNPVSVGLPTVTADADFDSLFSNFNPVPNLFGTASNGSPSATVLTTTGTSFSDSVVGSQLFNVSDGTSCEVSAFTATSLTCAEPLAGVPNSQWNSGDVYRVEVGSPLAMLEALLDNLDKLVEAIDNVSGAGLGDALNTELPVVGISPRALLGQIQEIRRTIDEIRQPAANILCGTAHTGGTITGDPSEITGNRTIFCNAVHNKPATEVVWTVAGAGATVTPPADPSTTVGAAPSGVVTITFAGAGTLVEGEDYRVNLAFTDNDGPHDAEYPSLSQPGSIQQLEAVLKEKLGLGDGFGLTLGEAGGNDVVVLDLAVQRCNSAALCDPGAVDPDDEVTTDINADVSGFGGLVSATSDGEISVGYNAEARIKLGFALSLTDPQVYVMPGTGIELAGQFNAEDLNFTAALGPFTVLAGTAAVDPGADPDSPDDDLGGLGTVKLGAQLSVGGAAITDPVEIDEFVNNLGTYLTPEFTALGTNECGNLLLEDVADPDPDVTVDLEGLGCAAISLAISAGGVTNYAGDLGLTVDENFVVTPHIPADLLAKLGAAALDLRLILAALPEIVGSVEDALRASSASMAGNGKIPLVGDALDAGADVAGALRDVTEFVVDSIPASVYEATTVEGVQTNLKQFIYDTFTNTTELQGLLRAANGVEAADAPDDIAVIVDCGVCDPTAAGSTLQIVDIRVIFGIGQTAFETELPFDLGMDGVPLRLAGSLAPSVDWNFVVDLGLSKTSGPYIGISDPAADGDPSIRPDEELKLTAGIGLGDTPGECPNFTGPPAAPIAGSWSTTKCLGGQIAFLGINVADSETNPTRLDLTAGLDLSNGSESTIGFGNAGDVSLDPVLKVEANVDLAFRTGIVGDQAAGFPSVVGHFGLQWAFGLSDDDDVPLAVQFDDLYLDVGPLVNNFLNPILSEVRRFTGPFQPIIDTLTAPIPVVSDLAEMVGQDPVTLLGLMEVISGNDLSMIQSIAAFITFINNPAVGDGFFPLGAGDAGGSFKVNKDGARKPQGPTDAAKLVEQASQSASLLTKSQQGSTGDANSMKSKAATAAPATKANLPGTFGVPGLTFPFLDNPSQIFGLLMGQDITLVRYDFGPMQASAGFSYNFPPIMVGPVPIAIGVGGSVTVRGRFAVGYDTSGLRKVLSGGSGMYLFDGIFIDDLDAQGVDVPEISFIGEVYAQAAVSVFVASAGIVAGLRITVDLNLNDSPEPDGKLRIEEIFNKLQNPICLFDISGKLTAFIKAFVELNLFITTLRFEFTLLELELLNFSGGCEPPKPKLAENIGGVLTLNIGDRAEHRNVSEEAKNEEFTVRPINAEGGFSVAAFGVYQTFGPGGEFGGPAITSVVGNAIDGDDTLKMLAGKDQEESPPEGATGAPEDSSIPFTIDVTLSGGDDNDVIQGGEGVDTLNGNAGNDRLNGAGGGDTLNGGAGVDTLNGDAGNDFLYGNEDADQLQGGLGDDYGEGGDGADLLQGGPGSGADGTDGSDTLIGGLGVDSIEGGTGIDYLYGDEHLTDCAADGADGDANDAGDKITGGDGADTLYGGLGNDEMYGGSGNDLLCGNRGDDTIEGDLGAATTLTDANPAPQVDTSGGNDEAQGGSGNDTIIGNFGHDFLRGNTGSDVASGGPGNDDVSGGLGEDRVNGDDGVDILVGDDAVVDQAGDKSVRTDPAALQTKVSGVGSGAGAGAPRCDFFSEAGDTDLADCIRGGIGRDLIYGEGGNDDIDGGVDDDLVFANDGADNPVRGGGGADVMYGNEGADVMYGDSGSDRMFGNEGVDDMRGGIDDDYMQGNQEGDVMRGEAGQDDIVGGTSSEAIADGSDTIYGGASSDAVVGDNGEITRPGGNDPTDATVILRSVTIFDVGAPLIGAGDWIYGETANDRIYSGNGIDHVFGGDGNDVVDGNAGGDLIAGDDGNDRIAGGSSTRTTLYAPGALVVVQYDHAPDDGDTIAGNAGDDVIAGDNARVNTDGTVVMTDHALMDAFGNDIISGDAGQDRIYGQLGADNLWGNADEDYIIGDLGFITPGAPSGFWPGGAPNYAVDLELGTNPDLGGVDAISGGSDDDHLFGGPANDVMQGDAGDDYMEGNGGSDAMYGFALDDTTTESDQDDMIGGSSSWTRSSSPRLDAGENLMQGNSDHDVMTGDNADIARITVGSAWAPDEVIAGARKRVITLLDREKVNGALSAVSGPDWMQGNDGSDRMYGEGDSDLVQGNADDDLIEGNQTGDWLEGNDGEDDVIGGSSLLANPGGVPLGGAGADLGDPDGSDAIFGGDGADVTVGDNAVVVRKTPTNTAGYNAAMANSPYFTSDPADNVTGWWLGMSTHRLVKLLDRATLNAGRFGDDVISGGAGPDVLFGQDGNDIVTGGAQDDAAEGNGGADQMFGDRTPETAPVPGVTFAAFAQWAGKVSLGAARDGASTDAGEDDLVGGSNVVHRDGGDRIEGDAEDDYQLGDNGTLQRQIDGGAYVNAPGDGPGHLRIFRKANRLGVNEQLGVINGNDFLYGNDGDDAIWGQEGNDDIRGHAGDDDLLGELGNDTIWGGIGEDALVGDRGAITNTHLGDAGALFVQAPSEQSYSGPPFFSVPVKYFIGGRYDRRVDLLIQRAGSVGGDFPGSGVNPAITFDGENNGGLDTMRGGPGHDSMHGAANDDIMNGDSGGDYMFGDNGSDVMWGGRGNDDGSADQGTDRMLIDRVFGGRGGDPNQGSGVITGGSDILDYRPRTTGPNIDPVAWVVNTSPYDDGTGNAGGSTNNQHHHGTDWIYGGWDRDVLEANVASPGPNDGDRLFDWTGAFNLYTHCTPDYGGYNDIRTVSPQMIAYMEYLAYDSGVGTSLADVQNPASSAYDELALVYTKDNKDNNGKAYPTTPGHFDQPASCLDD